MSGKLGVTPQEHKAGVSAPWRLLVVGEETTAPALRFRDRPVELVAAPSAESARGLLEGAAVVVGDAALARVVRDEWRNDLVRILLRGDLPPGELMTLDITDRLTGALTEATLHGALRAYEMASALEAARRAQDMLERMVGDRTRELEEANLILERLATTDPLTGIVNRRRFMDIASREVLRSKRTGAAISLVLLDIDHFRLVNDRHGIAAGDAVLLEVVHRVGQALRTLDVLGRLGGEEFAILLPEAAEEGAGVVAERLREAIAAVPIFAGDGRLAVTASLGVATLRSDETLDGLLSRADDALTAAKDAGRNRVVAG